MRIPRAVLVFLGAAALVFPGGTSGQSSSPAKPKTEKQSGFTKLHVEVTAGENNQPVESASVYVRFVQERALGKDRKTEMNVKTNQDGIVKVPDVPRGKVLIQVVAEGWKTFGRWYDIEGEEQTIKIHLVKPPRWY
jgi:hypothetical protein